LPNDRRARSEERLRAVVPKRQFAVSVTVAIHEHQVVALALARGFDRQADPRLRSEFPKMA